MQMESKGESRYERRKRIRKSLSYRSRHWLLKSPAGKTLTAIGEHVGIVILFALALYLLTILITGPNLHILPAEWETAIWLCGTSAFAALKGWQWWRKMSAEE